MKKNTLIAYFSHKGEAYVGGKIKVLEVGNTEVAANMIAEITGGDLFYIDTQTPYPYDHIETVNIAQDEKNANARPTLTDTVTNMDAYDTIILGYPNWWNTCPMAVFTFLESYDFTGKTILPLCTHEGSGLGVSEADIKRICPTAKVEKGLAITGGSVQKAKPQIEKWLMAARDSHFNG